MLDLLVMGGEVVLVIRVEMVMMIVILAMVGRGDELKNT